MSKHPESDEERLRRLTREAHEATQELRDTINYAERLLATMRDEPDRIFHEGAKEAVRKGLDEFQGTIERQIEAATQAVYRRFETITDVLLGTDAKSKRAGRPSIEDLARQKAGR